MNIKERTKNIPRNTLAQLTGCWPQEVTNWINGSRVSQVSRRKLETVLFDLEVVLKTSPLRPDLDDPNEVRKMIERSRAATALERAVQSAK